LFVYLFAVTIGGDGKQVGPVISDDQWDALCRAGEFLEHHSVFDAGKFLGFLFFFLCFL
jgi:hypothetical protein